MRMTWMRMVLTVLMAMLLAPARGSAAPVVERWNQSPGVVDAETIVARSLAATASLATGHIPSFRLAETTASWPASSGIAGLASYRGAVRSTSSWWYASPKRWRVSGRYLVPPRLPGMRGDELLGGTSFGPVPGTVVSDGRAIWRFFRRDRQVQVERLSPWDAITQFWLLDPISPFAQNSGSLPSWLAQAKQCWRPRLQGSATVAGRETYVLDLGPNLCLRGSASAREASGRSMLWVDKQTFFVLQLQQFDPANPSKLLYQNTVTWVRYHASIDPRLLRFRPPAETVIDDMRPQAVAAARPYQRALTRLARALAFPLLAPYDRPAGLTWGTPRLLGRERILLAFLPPETEGGRPAGRSGVRIVERRATAPDLERHAPGARWVGVQGASGWYGLTPEGHQLQLVREGTSIELTSRVLGRDGLIALASIIVPVAGGHEPVGIPGIPVLRAVRQELSFPVFVPTKLPAGLELKSIVEGDGRKNPSSSVEIDYGGRRGPLHLFQDFAGCCLDQDLRKWDDPFRLPDGVTAYRFLGGWPHVLWWDQAGTFIALTGPNLTERKLVQIAGSMSRTASPPREALLGSRRG